MYQVLLTEFQQDLDIKSEEEKMAHVQKLVLIKDLQFLSNPYEIW